MLARSRRTRHADPADPALVITRTAIRQYFVKGMPYLLKENIQPTRGIVNGTQALAHSLVMGDNTQLALGNSSL